jgi:hypothetical protein
MHFLLLLSRPWNPTNMSAVAIPSLSKAHVAIVALTTRVCQVLRKTYDGGVGAIHFNCQLGVCTVQARARATTMAMGKAESSGGHIRVDMFDCLVNLGTVPF